MKKSLLLIMLPATILASCSKKSITQEQSTPESPQTSRIRGNAIPGATDSITMDVAGDYVKVNDNRIKNDVTHMSYNTVQQGAGFLNGSTLPAVPVVKTNDTARFPNTHALKYDMPKRLSAVTYDQNDKDRLESYVFTASLANCTDNIHYSGFSLYIPSGKDKINGWFDIHQWHQSSPESPPIAFELESGYYSRLKLAIRYGVSKGNNDHTVYLARVDTTASNTKFVDLPRDKWIDFIVRWKFDATGTTGVCAVYRHDASASSSTLIFNYSGQIGYSGVTTTAIDEKFGIYRAADYAGSHQIIYDQLRVGPSWDTVKPWP